MRLGWLALPLLIAAPACSPVRDYQEAARSLRISLDRVEPSLQLAFPPSRSRVNFDLSLGVENPSTVDFHLRGFEGQMRLESEGRMETLGHVEMLRALDLPAGGRSELAVRVSFGYQDVAQSWPALEAALHADRPGAWSLEGTLRGEVHGIPVKLPVKTRRTFGTAP